MAVAMIAAAATSSKAIWYLTRGTGLVALILLTASVVLGITEVTRWTSRRFPRFVTAALHKNISLLVLVFLGIHIVTAIADSFAPIGWLDVVLPFHSPYRPLWLGLGAVAVDLLLALTITSLLRNRVGYRVWRAVHWAAYACWPIAFLHGLGTGSDTRVRWSLLLSIACLAAVVAAVAWRLSTARGTPVAQRAGLGAATGAVLIGVLGWTYGGPTQPGWARRAGTPSALLRGAVPASAKTPVTALRVPFDASFSGTVNETAAGGGATVTIAGTLSGGTKATLQIVIEGTALSGGGVQMNHSTATLGTAASPRMYQGSVTNLDGSSLDASVRNSAGAVVRLAVDLNLGASETTFSGSVSATGA
jgi:sulfoxide reductase heme-binding subunit YedZ